MQERLRLQDDGRVALELSRGPGTTGTRELVFEPLEFLPTAALAPGADGAREQTKPRSRTWAALMHRAFAIDVLACPRCEGRLRLIATLHDPAVIRKILAHVGISPSGPGPRLAPPRPDRIGWRARRMPRGAIGAAPAG